MKRRRSAEWLEAAERCVLAQRSALLQRGWGVALRSGAALRHRGGVLAPLLPERATAWQPPAAKEGQGDCDFPLGPPWILLYPLKRRRSAEGLEAAGRGVLTRRSSAGALSMRGYSAVHARLGPRSCRVRGGGGTVWRSVGRELRAGLRRCGAPPQGRLGI